MKLVLIYDVPGDYECNGYDVTVPFEYESVEKAEYDLLTLWENHKNVENRQHEQIIFAKTSIYFDYLTYYTFDYVHKRQEPKYIEPKILTLEDWWDKYYEN